MIQRASTIGLSILTVTALLGAIVTYARPVYAPGVEVRIGDAADYERVRFTFVDGMARVEHGVSVTMSPPFRQARCVARPGLIYTSVDLPGRGGAYRLRTLSLSLWLAALVLSAYPLLKLVVQPLHRRARRARGRCPSCGYDLTGIGSGVCSECGRPV